MPFALRDSTKTRACAPCGSLAARFGKIPPHLGTDGLRWAPRSSKPLRGMQNVLDVFESHTFPPTCFTKTTTKVPVPIVVVLTTGTKQLRNTDFARQVLKNASTCIVIKMKHLPVVLFVTLLQQCDIIHTR